MLSNDNNGASVSISEDRSRTTPVAVHGVTVDHLRRRGAGGERRRVASLVEEHRVVQLVAASAARHVERGARRDLLLPDAPHAVDVGVMQKEDRVIGRRHAEHVSAAVAVHQVVQVFAARTMRRIANRSADGVPESSTSTCNYRVI
jgi:hypothetical protein